MKLGEGYEEGCCEAWRRECGVDITYQNVLYKGRIFSDCFVLKNRLPHSGLQRLPQAQHKQVLTEASEPHHCY